MNPETVRSEQAKGEPIYCGDATHEPILQHANLRQARIVVVAINDPTATRRIAEAVRRLNRKVHLIVRTRYLQEMNPLYQLGADEVIPEEFETSVEIFTRVLNKYFVPIDEIEKLVAKARADGYQMFRSFPRASPSLADLKLQLGDIDISAFRISPGSPLVGKTLAQVELRGRYGVCAVAIRRNSQILSNPDADTLLQSGDVLFLLGSSLKLSEAMSLFSSSHKPHHE